MLSSACLVLATPTPPVFPVQWSAHVHTIASFQTLDCDFAFDAVNNLTVRQRRVCRGYERRKGVTNERSDWDPTYWRNEE